jgi:hypothetical protein
MTHKHIESPTDSAARASDRVLENINFARRFVTDRMCDSLPQPIAEIVARNLALSLPDASTEYVQAMTLKGLQSAVREHQRVVKIAVQRARAEMPVRHLRRGELTLMVEYCLSDAIEERKIVIEKVFASLPGDLFFVDVLWPATKIRLASELGITVSIDDSRFQSWLNRG